MRDAARRPRRRSVASLAPTVAMLVAVACTSPATPPATPSVSPPVSPRPAPSLPTPEAEEVPRTVGPPAPMTPRASVHAVTVDELGATWRVGCPVGPDALRRVELPYRGLDGAAYTGELVVAATLADEVIAIFGELYALGFPIARMRSVAAYPDAQDEASMTDNNTSAYNCRPLPGGTRWSEHAYGRAVDLNPLLNPFVDARGRIEPGSAGPWTDRSRGDAGMIVDGDAVVAVFARHGWSWGGHWRTPKDYQHFERD